MDAVLDEWDKRQKTISEDYKIIDMKIEEKESSLRLITDKIKILSSETVIRLLESDITKLEGEIAKLKEVKERKDKSTTDIKEVIESIKYFMEHHN